MSLISTPVTALVNVLRAAGLPAEKRRRRPIKASDALRIVVRPGPGRASDTTELPTGYPVAWGCLFVIECYVRANPEQSDDEAVAPVVAAVYAALRADPTLGGAVSNAAPLGYDFEDEAADEGLICVSLTINIRQQSAGNPF